MNTEKTYTTMTALSGGTVKLEHNYPKRPSWKNYGQGRAIVTVNANPSWPSVDISCAEIPESGRGTKRVYVSLPTEALADLLRQAGYTITKNQS